MTDIKQQFRGRAERVQFVVDQTLRGVSFTDTAKILGVTRERVRQIAKTQGLTAQDWRTEYLAQREVQQAELSRRRRQAARATVRARQRQRRLALIQCVRELRTEHGEAPTLRQVAERSGMFMSDVCRYFVGRMQGDWGRRATRRLYRLAGTTPRKRGRPGWIS